MQPIKLLLCFLFTVLPAFCLTTVTQAVQTPDGTPGSGNAFIRISNPCTSGSTYVGDKTINIRFSGGNFSVNLVPNDTCVPANTTYTVGWLFTGGSSRNEVWYVPTSGTPVSIDSVRIAGPLPVLPLVNPIQIARAGATTNQALCWNGTAWGPGSCGGASPGGGTGAYQFNNAGALGGQAFILAGGAIGTELQAALDQKYVVITQGGNLTLSGTANQNFTLATGVSCNTRWSRVLISVTTSFTGGTGGLSVKLQHGSVDLTPLFDVTQAGGDVNFYSDIPGTGCMGSGTATLQLVFVPDGTHDMNLFTAGAVTVEIAGYAAR